MPERAAVRLRWDRGHRRRRATRAHGTAHGGIAALALVWGAWLVLMSGVNLATPLYAVYATRFGFSSLVLTAIFAAYAAVLTPALLLFGRLSDRVGRRPVMFAGLLTACAGLALFAAAQGTAWLFGARVLQGLAVGMISAPATAALVEFDPRRDEQRPALLAGLAQAGGSAAGPLLAGVLAEWAPAPRQLVFLIMLGLTLVAAAAVLTLSEPADRDREPWRPQWPRVPSGIRADFARVSLTAATVWGTVAVLLSIVPSYSSDLLSSHNLALLAAVSALALVASCGAQIASQRAHPPVRAAQALGLAMLAAGLSGLVIAAPLHSLTLLIAGAVIAGTGHGLGFLNAQDELNRIAPAERRGEVTSAFISCIYVVVAGSVISTGLLDEWVSLTVSVAAVAVTLGAAAIAIACWQAEVAYRTSRGGSTRR